MAKMVIVDASKCVGCRVCELACSARKVRSFGPVSTGVVVVKDDVLSLDVPAMCEHCEKAACVSACPTGAMHRNQATGAVVVAEKFCIGCLACLSACPFGSILSDPERKRPVKCDLCEGSPECVEICPAKALTFGEPDRVILAKRREIAFKASGLAIQRK